MPDNRCLKNHQIPKEGIPIDNQKISFDSPELDADWEHFMATVNSRYGETETAPVAEKVPQISEELLIPEESEIPEEPVVVQPRRSAPPKKRKSGLPVAAVIAGVAALLLLALVLVPMIRNAMDPYGGKICPGVTVGGVELGGLSRRQAEKALEAATGYDKNDMVLSLPGTTLRLTPKDTGVKLDTKGAIAAAYGYGREAGTAAELDIASYLTLDEAYIQSVLADYAEQLGASYTPAKTQMQGSIPTLTEAGFDAAAQLPTLVLSKGVAGYRVDRDALFQRVKDAYESAEFSVDCEDLVSEEAAEEPDLEQAQKEFCIAPVDAQLDSATKKAVPGTYGLTFDAEEAAKQLKNAKAGEPVSVSMEYVAPEIIGQEVYFQDVLGFCQTPHGNNEKRNVNLRLACEAINGIVLQPGDVLSYNDTLGERTAERGYQPAPAYSGTNLVDSLGGGICQVSSTLYLCSLYAELETVERVSHGYPANYMPIGLDATVSWGNPDLKICNDSDYPIKIVAEEKDDFVRVWIMGTETRDYYIRVAYSSSDDGYAKSYICKYDRKTDEQISREDHRYSSYLSGGTSLRGEIGMDEAYINGLARKQDPCTPTQETLKASRDYKNANQFTE